MKSYCTKCNRLTNQLVMKEEKTHIFEEETGWWEDSTFQIIQCMGCDEISFRKLYDDASIQHEPDTELIQMLYPERGVHSIPIKPYRGLPFNIQTIYRETIDAYNSNLNLLCGVGVRAIVEAICIDKSIIEGKVKTKSGKERNSKNLDGKISGLASKGFITSDNAEVLHELRFLGNDAIHEISQPSIEELRVAIEIIELIIENIYFVKRKALYLQQKRVSRKK